MKPMNPLEYGKSQSYNAERESLLGKLHQSVASITSLDLITA